MRARLALVAALLCGVCACAAPRAAADWASVRAELARRVEVDQEARRALVAGSEVDAQALHRLVALDEGNTAWMKDLVGRHGWPTVTEVGSEAAGHAWLLVQHADHDVDFQERCLELLRTRVAAGEADAQHAAYLSDRVAMHRGRPQRYGTQFVQRDGALEPYLLEDPARVDAWRAEVGLGTLAEYRRALTGD